MSYTNATFYVDLEGGSDTARTALTTVTVANPSGTITRCTKVAHGLVTGAVVDLTLFTAWLNAAWKVTVVDADNFDLDGAVWQATADNNGTVTPRGGSSKADAWKTVSSTGASSARHAAGDTIRVMASPDPTLVGDATWTNLSKTVTLASAVTANIADCETAWTGSANTTVTADTAEFKENTKSMKCVFAAGFTTGLAAYFATGTLDLSAYQQVSFWLRTTGAVAANTLSLRLCTDTVGAVSVHTLVVPALPSVAAWIPLTVNVGSALNSAIASVALYCDLDPGTVTIQLDNIIACKAAASADALTLQSLIGKVWNLNWVASATYATNDIRIPTQPNRNGYRYKVTAGGGGAAGSTEPTWPQEIGRTVADGALTWTCEGLEDTWYCIQSINGTTVKLDNNVATLGSAGRGYSGSTETVPTYKREPINIPVSPQVSALAPTRSGTATAFIAYSGGWNRTDMSTRTGDTWISKQNNDAGWGVLFSNAITYLDISGISGARAGIGFYFFNMTAGAVIVKNCHMNACTVPIDFSTQGGAICYVTFQGLVMNNAAPSTAANGSFYLAGMARGTVRAMTCSNNRTGPGVGVEAFYVPAIAYVDVVAKNNLTYGMSIVGTSNTQFVPSTFYGLVTADNSTGGVSWFSGNMQLTNSLIQEGTEFSALTAQFGRYNYSHKHDQVADNHLIVTDGGTIVSATDQRHTASGISWKFLPTSTNHTTFYPLVLPVAKVACAANALVTISIWTRRDSTNIAGRLKVRGGQLAGVLSDVIVDCAPSINTWVQSSNLTFTPTEAGVVEVTFEVYDGVGTSNAFWCDDLVIT